MLNYFKRIAFAIMMTFLFFTGLTVANTISRSRQIAQVIDQALEEDNYHLFLNGSYQSHNSLRDLTYTHDDLSFNIKVYETASVIDEELTSYLEMFIIVDSGEFHPMRLVTIHTDGIIDESDEENEDETTDIPIEILQVINTKLHLISNFNENNSRTSRISLDRLYKHNATTVEEITIMYDIPDENQDDEFITITLTINLDIKKDELTFTNVIETYYNNNNNQYPTSDTQEIKIMQGLIVDTSQTVVITAIFLVIGISLFTVYVFIIRPKRKLGKKKPSKHLQKDLEELKSKRK